MRARWDTPIADAIELNCVQRNGPLRMETNAIMLWPRRCVGVLVATPLLDMVVEECFGGP